jgi:squalene-associated FAD-dependent desaturase
LAGLAAAAALSGRGFEIELFEARRQLGGRAASFRDPASGELVDHCQHVSMGCCTNLADFCRRTGIADAFQRHRRLNFFGPDGRQYAFGASRWLPAPLHLGPAFLRLGYLTLGERLGVARALLKLARTKIDDDQRQPTIGQWLRQQRQSPAAIERFWAVVLVSALGEEIERASLAAARKVFVDGFMAAREAYEVEAPQIPLGELYGRRLETWLDEQRVNLWLGAPVERVTVERDAAGALRATGLSLPGGVDRPFDAVIAALPWRRVREVFDEPALAALPELAGAEEIEAAPITGVHLWFDREITSLPHAVLVGKLSQWMFNRGRRAATDGGSPGGHYYQVVISASRDLAGRDRDEVIAEIVSELASIWPAARSAKLMRSRMVTEQTAVFSVRPGLDRLRPPQQTSIANLALAGDWTRTGWPATMEGAVRSGYLAAEAVLKSFGKDDTLIVADLPRGRLARWIL